MAGSDKTVFDPCATVAESDKTVLESDATVLDDGTTLLEAALSDAAGQMDADARENIAIQKGDTILDTYRVESDVIEGGMGSVWRVRHTSWNIDLAMKRPQPKCFSTEKSKADFIHECEAWINLGLHPNIVSCYYVREIFGTPSIFSEWMDGGSLERAIQKGTIYGGTEAAEKERLLDIVIQFARGLHYAHEAGLIHQDVKPDNVLLTKEGEAKVADFGLARARAVLTVLEGERTMSEPLDGGKTMLSPSGGYTPAYCSMEQIDGKELTRRTDIYSWAVSVMEMYIGSRPWANGVVAGLSCAEYFKKARVPMPEALKDLLRHCLDSVPEDRPHDFAEIESKLHEIYEAETGTAYPRPAPKAAADTADSLNNRALSFLDLGKIDEAEECWRRALKADATNPEAIYNQALFNWINGKADDKATLLAVDTIIVPDKREMYCSRVEKMRANDKQLPSAYDLEVMRERFTPLLNAETARDMQIGIGYFNLGEIVCFEPHTESTFLIGRDWVGASSNSNSKMRRFTKGVSVRVSDPPAHPGRVTSSADGKWLCFFTEHWTCLYDIEHDTFGKRVEHETPVSSSCAAENGEGFYQGRRDGLYYYDLATGREKRLYQTNSFCRLLTPGPDGRLVAWRDKDENGYIVRAYDVTRGVCSLSVYVKGETPALAFSSDGKQLYIGDSQGDFLVCDVADGIKCFHCPSGDRMTSICAVPDGRNVLSGHASGSVRIWDLERRMCLRTYSGFNDAHVFPDYDKDGTLCVGSLSGSGKYLRYPFPQLLLKPVWEVSAIMSTAAQILQEARFLQAISFSEKFYAQKDYPKALEWFKEARAVAGFSNDPRCLVLYKKLASHFRFGRLNGLVMMQQLPLLKGVTFSSDGATVMDGQMYTVWSVESGTCLITKSMKEKRRYYDAAFLGGNQIACCYKQGEQEELMVDLFRLPGEGKSNVELVFSGCVYHGNGVSGVTPSLVASPECKSFAVSFPGFSRNRYVAVNGNGATLGAYPPPQGVWAVVGTKDILTAASAFLDAKGVVRLTNGKRLLKWSRIPDIQRRVFRLMQFETTADENEKLGALVSVSHRLLRKEKLQHLVDAQDNKLYLFSLETGKLLRSVHLPRGTYHTHHDGYLTCVRDNSVLLYDIAAFMHSGMPEPICIPVRTSGREVSFSANMLYACLSLPAREAFLPGKGALAQTAVIYLLDWDLI